MENNYYYQVPPKKTNGMETAALVLAVIGIATGCCIYIAAPCDALAIILGYLSQGSNPPGQLASRTAKIAITLGIVSIVFSILLLAAMFIFTFASGSMDFDTYLKEIENYSEFYESIYQDTL